MSHLATEQAKASAEIPLGVYVHVPFCASTCDFCAFYQTKPTAQRVKSFLDGIARETELISWPRPPSTVFWGGGTPGLLSPRDLAQLAATIRERCAPSVNKLAASKNVAASVSEWGIPADASANK